MEYILIQNKEELELLKGKSAQYNGLNFSFSDEYLKSLKDLFNEKNALQIFAKDDSGTFAGYIAVAEKEMRLNFFFIVELFIDLNYQRQGIGLSLLKCIIREAKKKNLTGIIAETQFKNFPAQNFYKKVGFIKIDNPDWKDGITYQYLV